MLFPPATFYATVNRVLDMLFYYAKELHGDLAREGRTTMAAAAAGAVQLQAHSTSIRPSEQPSRRPSILIAPRDAEAEDDDDDDEKKTISEGFLVSQSKREREGLRCGQKGEEWRQEREQGQIGRASLARSL